MTIDSGGSVSVPQHSEKELVFQGVPLVKYPPAVVKAVDRENCIIEYRTLPLANGGAYVPQPEKHLYIYFNKITGFYDKTTPVRNPVNGSVMTGRQIFPSSEEPVMCASGGGSTVQGVPLPQQLTCFTDLPLTGTANQETFARLHKAIDYMYSQYCKLAKKKNAF
jgi:hypothetical protein